MASKQSNAAEGRVLVFARSRPFLAREGGDLQAVHMDTESETVVVSTAPDAMSCLHSKEEVTMERSEKSYKYDGAFPEEAGQKEVFQRVGLPVLVEVMKGFNGCIFAYGQTGSGKTYSLLNTEVSDMDQVGILPRLVATLFARAAMDKKHVYSIKCAGFQVYNEQVDDLLHPEHRKGEGQNLSVVRGGQVGSLSWVECKTPASMLDAFKKARAGLHYAETKMNKSSSRSHAVFQIRILRRARVGKADGAQDGATRRMQATCGQLSVVDLAGSERVKRSGVTGSNFKEATKINGSLLALGNVIQALADKRAHVPFRDSKLTRILEGSVGGNCKTSLLVCVSPADNSTSESLSTLEFASRAMRVEVDAKVNETTVELDASLLAADMEDESGTQYVDEEMLKTFKESEQALAEAKAKALEQEQEAATLKAQVTEMSSAVQAKEHDLSNALQENEKNRSEIMQLKESLAADEVRHKKEIEESQKLSTKLQEQLSQTEKDILQTKQSIKQLTQQYNEEQTARKEAEQRLGQLERQAKANEESAAAALAASEAAGEQLKEELQKEVRARAEQEAALKTQIEEEKKLSEQLNGRIRALDSEKTSLQGNLDAMNRQLSSTTNLLTLENEKVSKLTVIQEEAKQLRAQLEDSHTTAVELKARLSGAEADKVALNETLENLTQTYQVLKSNFEQEELARKGLEQDKEGLLESLAKEQSAVARGQKALTASEQLITETAKEHALAISSLKESHKEEITSVVKKLEADAEKQARHAAEALQALETRAQHDCEKLSQRIESIEAAKAQAELDHQANVERIIEQHRQSLQEALAKERGVHEKQCGEFRRRIDMAMEDLVKSEEASVEREQTLNNQWEHKLQYARAGAATARVAQEKERAILLGKHQLLQKRFAARESRQEDIALIARQQKDINDMKQTVKNIKKLMRHKELELQHVMDNVRIFGTPYDRPGAVQNRALPGHKVVGKMGSFIDRKKATTSIPIVSSGASGKKTRSRDSIFSNPVQGARPSTAAAAFPSRRTETPVSFRADSPSTQESERQAPPPPNRRGRPLPTPPTVSL